MGSSVSWDLLDFCMGFLLAHFRSLEVGPNLEHSSVVLTWAELSWRNKWMRNLGTSVAWSKASVTSRSWKKFAASGYYKPIWHALLMKQFAANFSCLYFCSFFWDSFLFFVLSGTLPLSPCLFFFVHFGIKWLVSLKPRGLYRWGWVAKCM